MKKRNSDPYVTALCLLAGRDYTVAGIRRKLLSRGFLPDSIEVVLEKLLAGQILDDSRYAERFVLNSRETGRYAGYRLKQELLKRGISKELVHELLCQKIDASEEKSMASELLKRRYPGISAGSSDERERRRAAGFLQRRGFGSAIVWSVLQNAGDPYSVEVDE